MPLDLLPAACTMTQACMPQGDCILVIKSHSPTTTCCTGGSRALGTLLLTWSKSFSNFAELAQSARLFGWSEASVNEPCSWTCIYCGADGGLGISLRNLGLSGAHGAVENLASSVSPARGASWPAYFARPHESKLQIVLRPAASGACAGRFDPSWDALGPTLQSMNMDGSILPYQLPPSWGQAWQNVTFISFGRAQLASTLPRGWGVQGAFQRLFQSWFYDNPGLTGDFGFFCMVCWMLHVLHAHGCIACCRLECIMLSMRLEAVMSVASCTTRPAPSHT